MPAHERSGSDQNERLRPPRPEPSQRDPEQLVQRRESTARSGGVKSQQLLTEGEIFENEILSRTESTDNPAQEMPEEHDHGKNLIPTSQIELLVKLLIMRVFDLLANDTPQPDRRD